MQIRTIFKNSIGPMAAIAAALFLAGCFQQPSEFETGFANFISEEVSDAGAVSAEIIGKGPLAKQLATAADTIKSQLSIQPFRYDEAAGGWVREGVFTTSGGYERTRKDTICLKDGSGATVMDPSFGNFVQIVHIRRVFHSKGGDQADIRIYKTTDITTGDEIVAVSNGTLSGTFNGEEVASGSINAVTRKYENGRWRFPESGSILADFPRYKYEVQYLGDGQASAYITNKRRDRVHQIDIKIQQ
jgi:hypothetical protein